MQAAPASNEPLSIVVVGASGDLALKKVYPALFALFCQGLLPEELHVVGFSRSAYSDDEFRDKVTEHLTCRYTPGASCAQYMERFLARCIYAQGQYGSRDAFLDLYARMRAVEGDHEANRLYYLAIPPFLFLDVARAIGDAGLVVCGPGPPWSRVVVEKPFGRDRASSDELTGRLAQVFTEAQTFRIDHYLGKEVIQNLLVLRFGNLIFEPIWNRSYIKQVRIAWKEDIGVGDRGGYFDAYGIIRDVVQNHLLQILALVAMEPPDRLDAHHVCNEKVKVLRAIPPVSLEDMVLGQYASGEHGDRTWPAYPDEPSVPDDSLTPTFAAATLRVDNPRWNGVPFVITAGKGLDARATEIRIEFRPVRARLFGDAAAGLVPNELVIRVQPDESIALHLVNKRPGIGMGLGKTELDLRYAAAFDTLIPDAYECLLLDVIRGDKSLFIRADELEAAWDVFTPVLHAIERRALRPESYPFGGGGPPLDALLRTVGSAGKDPDETRAL